MSTLFFGHFHIHLDSTDSTNSHAMRLLENEEIPEGGIVSAGVQTAGRGQRGSQWESFPNENLLFTLLLKPAFLGIGEQMMLTLFASLGICSYVTSRLKNTDKVAGVRIKWPNDIYYGDRKLAGILIENQISGTSVRHSLTGIGLNLNSRMSEMPFPSVSLREITGKLYDVRTELTELAGHLESYYLRLRSQHYGDLREKYHSLLYRKDEPQRFRSGTCDWTGIIRGITDTGLLLVEREGKLETFAHKELIFLI
ncbi:MAG: biotin--[acetyl-CoA-carboxylase] ligase [Bacteroidia bacterium]|nr:biotin--[acetyl-CoA-carboxylase] ligase [Bacteroidia bacterium]